MESKEERKTLLKDWMTSVCQLMKINNPTLQVSDITELFRKSEIKMTDKWVARALYGARPPGRWRT